MANVDQAASSLIQRVGRRLRYRLDAQLDRFDLTSVQCGLLLRLGEHDGIAQSELQCAMAIEGATLTHIVQRLEREGWIERACDPSDRRRQRVWLCERGRLMLPELTAAVEDYRKEVVRGLDPDETAMLSSLLRRVEENLL